MADSRPGSPQTLIPGKDWIPTFVGKAGLILQAQGLGGRAEVFYAYLMASRRNGTLYAGSTDSMTRRAWEHREQIRRGFTAKYGVHLLVWYQAFETREGAKKKERQIKEWKRAWKLELIEKTNPEWKDLYEALFSLSPDDGADGSANSRILEDSSFRLPDESQEGGS